MAEIWSDFERDYPIGHGRSEAVKAGVSAALPIAAFLGVHVLGQALGLDAIYPKLPFGLPAWSNALALAVTLPMWGYAHFLVSGRGPSGRIAGRWIVVFAGLLLVLPFALASFDAFFGGIFSLVVLLSGIIAAGRAGAISGRAGLLLLPGLLWTGVGALAGFGAVAGGWSPPFALMNRQN